VCTHPIDPMGIHLLRYAHGNKHTRTHDVIHDTFVVIVWDAGFHVGRKKLHVFPSTTFNFFCQRDNIVLTKNDINTLADIIIANLTRANLFPRSYITQGFDAFDVAQVKERSYCNWHPTNQFLPLVIEVFGCLHKYVYVFLHDCANAIWSLKGTKGPHLSTLVTFICKKISITLQTMRASSILSRAVAIGLTTSWFPPLQDTPPITTVDLLQAVNFWQINMTNLPQAINYGHGEIFIATLSQLDILSLLPFPLFYSFVHFPNLWCVS